MISGDWSVGCEGKNVYIRKIQKPISEKKKDWKDLNMIERGTGKKSERFCDRTYNTKWGKLNRKKNSTIDDLRENFLGGKYEFSRKNV